MDHYENTIRAIDPGIDPVKVLNRMYDDHRTLNHLPRSTFVAYARAERRRVERIRAAVERDWCDITA